MHSSRRLPGGVPNAMLKARRIAGGQPDGHRESEDKRQDLPGADLHSARIVAEIPQDRVPDPS